MPTTTAGRDRAPVSPSSTPSGRLRADFAAAKVSFTWLGVRKSLSADQKEQAADSFGAQGTFLWAAKKLLDTRDPKFQAVTSVRNRIGSYWKSLSLPYPEPGLRLIRRDDIESFDRQMTRLKEELGRAVQYLDEHFDTLKSAARDRLGSLYNPLDYPASLQGLFDVSWEFPSVEPPEYLLRLSPEPARRDCVGKALGSPRRRAGARGLCEPDRPRPGGRISPQTSNPARRAGAQLRWLLGVERRPA